MKPTRFALAAFVVACACSSAPPKPAGQAAWSEIRTEHVNLLTDASEEEGRQMAAQCERLRAALIAGSWSSGQTPLREVRVIALADRNDFLAHIPLENFDGWTLSGIDGQRVLVIYGGRDPSEQATLKHELAHALNGEFLLRQPRWFSEGLAEYLETLRVQRGGGAMVLGEPNPGIRSYLKRYPKLDFAKVMNTGAEVIAAKRDDVFDFYAQSWLVTYVLMNRHRADLGNFVHRLARAEDPKAAFAAAFPGLTAEDLEREASKSFGPAQSFTLVEIPLPPLGNPAQARKLNAAETRAVEAELQIYSARLQRKPDLLKQAFAEMRAVIAEDPTNLRAGLVAVASAANPQERLAVARELAEKNPQKGVAQWLFAVALGGSGARGPERRDALEKAAALSPDDPRILNSLAWDDLLTARASEALPLAARAAKLKPGDPMILDTLALALEGAGKCQTAAQVQERAIELLPDNARPSTVADFRRRSMAYHARCEHTEDDEARRLACQVELPPGPAASVTYSVAEDGKVGGVQVDGPADRAIAVERWLVGCIHQPAVLLGKAVASSVSEQLPAVPAPQAQAQRRP